MSIPGYDAWKLATPPEYDITPDQERRMEDEETRRLAIEEAIAACNAELVIDPDNADDETYNRAIGHCVEAIRGLIA